MDNLTAGSYKSVIKAFSSNRHITIRKKNGQVIGPGTILIMYDEAAFRMQSTGETKESHFVSLGEIEEVTIH